MMALLCNNQEIDRMYLEQATFRQRRRFFFATHPRFRLILAAIVLLLLMTAIALADPSVARSQGTVAEDVPISTDRPGQSTPPAIQARGTVQIEVGFQVVGDKPAGGETTVRTLSLPQALIRVGVLSSMEFRLQGEFRSLGTTASGTTSGSHSGLAGLSLGSKLGVAQEKGMLPETALLLTLALPVGDMVFRSPTVAPTFLFAMRNALSGPLNLYYTVGATWDGINVAGYGIYTLALSNSFTSSLSGFVEVYGTLAPMSSPVHSADAGISLVVMPNIQLDLFGGTGITENAPDYFANAGVSIRLPR